MCNARMDNKERKNGDRVKGASINDVRKMFLFFYPLPPCHVHNSRSFCLLFGDPSPTHYRRHIWKPLTAFIIRCKLSTFYTGFSLLSCLCISLAWKSCFWRIFAFYADGTSEPDWQMLCNRNNSLFLSLYPAVWKRESLFVHSTMGVGYKLLGRLAADGLSPSPLNLSFATVTWNIHCLRSSLGFTMHQIGFVIVHQKLCRLRLSLVGNNAKCDRQLQTLPNTL